MSKYHQMGYLMADDRASGGSLTEADVWTCNHCQKLLIRQQWSHDGGWCSCCMAPLCGPCADALATGACVPFKALVDRQLDANYRQQQNARVLGLDGKLIVGGVEQMKGE